MLNSRFIRSLVSGSKTGPQPIAPTTLGKRHFGTGRAKIVGDVFLRQLAEGDPLWALGSISEEDQALLCMYLSELARELLSHRQANGFATVQRKRSPYPQPRNHGEEIANARAAFERKGPHHAV